MDAGTYGGVSTVAGGVAAGADVPECAEDATVANCADAVAGTVGFGAGLSAGEVDWANGITAIQGLLGSGGIGTTTWDGLKPLAEANDGTC